MLLNCTKNKKYQLLIHTIQLLSFAAIAESRLAMFSLPGGDEKVLSVKTKVRLRRRLNIDN